MALGTSIANLIQTVEADPATAEHAGALRECELAARRRGRLWGWVAILALVAVSLIVMVIVFWGEWEHFAQAMEYMVYVIVWPTVLLAVGLALLIYIVVAVELRSTYIRYRMIQTFDELIPEPSPPLIVARGQVSPRPAQVLFRFCAVVIPAVLAVLGLIWAALFYYLTATALECAKSSKCL
jgi:hypothetical protein